MIVGGNIGQLVDRVDEDCVGQVLEHAPDGRQVAWTDSNNGGQHQDGPDKPYKNFDGPYCQEVGAAHLATQAAANRATVAESGSAAAVAAAVEVATKKIGAELAAVRERAGWAGSTDGAKVAGCKLPGWEQHTDTKTGNQYCIVRSAEKPTFGAEIEQVYFWMPKTKK